MGGTWKPAGGQLDIELTKLSDSGAVIFPNGPGQVPNLRGRLNPILEDPDRTHLYTDNVATDDRPHSQRVLLPERIRTSAIPPDTHGHLGVPRHEAFDRIRPARHEISSNAE